MSVYIHIYSSSRTEQDWCECIYIYIAQVEQSKIDVGVYTYI